MSFVNPFSNDPERAPVFESGYEAGFSEPEVDHAPPLAPELVDAFDQGEQQGRDDRRQEPSVGPPLPSAPSEDFSRFETAPDGTLIPVPDECPPGNVIRSNAQVGVSPKTSGGYYVTIFNGPPGSISDFQKDLDNLPEHLLTEAHIAAIEHVLAHAVIESTKLLVKFGGLAVSVIISVLTPSPILKESRFRAYLPDQTPISYVVLTPQE
jgi:hypothetical protein